MKGQQDLKMEESKRLINVAYFLKANFKTKFYVNQCGNQPNITEID